MGKKKEFLIKSIFISSIILGFILFSVSFFKTITFANELTSVNPPTFPSCESKTPPGDWVTSTHGFHHIPGQEATIEGSDDVYQISEGNFIQCLCPKEGTQGIQTNWWLVGNMSTEEVNTYTSNGWYYEDGGSWNLIHDNYLAKNGSYTCRLPESTPTLTPTAIPTSTPIPTASPTPGSGTTEESPRCSGLSASPSEGSKPLTVKFTGSGFDKNGPILEYEFNFADDSGFQPKVWRQKDSTASHRYENSGTFVATLSVKDQGGQWRDGSDCKVTIKVLDQPQVLSASTASSLPNTGGGQFMGFAMMAFGSIGVFLYKHFKLL